MPEKKPKNVPFQIVIAALLDESKVFPPSYLHRFSNISESELDQVRKVWLQVNPARRLALIEDLEELAESDFLVILNNFSRFALDDPDPAVRTVAVRMLWDDPDLSLIVIFTRMMLEDSEPTVRAAAASALGMFVYLGELEEIPTEKHQAVEDTLLRVMGSPEQSIVRRRALESLGFSSRDEVVELIQSGFDSSDIDWQTSALYAMGRSADPRWEQAVLSMLDHEDTGVQTESVRAAGNLELAQAREPLLALLEIREDLDDEVYAAAIWSLSQIGGENVRETLEQLAETVEDEDEQEYIERALENLEFTEDFGILDMFDFDPDHPIDLTHLDTDPDDDEEEDSRPSLN
jgi:hypothetical protein